MTDELKPVAWMYELAGARFTNLDGSKSYTNWKSHITAVYPNVPVDGLRNLTPLYTAAQLEALQQRVRELEEALDRIYMEDRRIVERWRQSLATGDSHLDERIVLGRYAEIARKALGDTHD